jgi:hypothetical protein
MISLRKKTAPRPWHPDFRIAESLPDIKIVRTGFLINLLAILIAVILLLVVGYRETLVWNAHRDIDLARDLRAGLKPENDRALALNRAFMEARATYRDLEVFFSAPFHVDRLILDLAEAKPDEISLETLTYRVAEFEQAQQVHRRHSIQMRANTRSIPDPVETYRRRLRAIDYLNRPNLRIQDSNPRQTDGGNFAFDLSVVFSIDQP